MTKNKYIIESSKLENINNICVLCWGRIGDVFFRVSIIEAVKIKYPNSKIYAVVDPCGYDVLKNHPDIFETIIVNRSKKSKVKYFKEIYNKSRKIRNTKIDLCINLYSGGSSAFFSLIINARIRLGFDNHKPLRRFNTLLVKYPEIWDHWTRCFATMLKPIGIETNNVRLGTSFYTTKKSLDKADNILIKNTRYIIFNLGTGVIDKNWPILSYVQLANKIHSEYELIPIVITNPDLPELAQEFHQQCNHSIIMPLSSLDEIAGLLTEVGMLVTGDTSIMHLAFGVKVANLVMFTKTRPETVWPEDCIHEACFIEDKSSINRFGKPDGTLDIPVEYAFECFKKLKRRVDNEQNNKISE